MLETIEEGEHTVGTSGLKIKRYYCDNRYVYLTRVQGEQKRAAVCILHGLGQSSDVFIEIALSFALNGFVVHMADLEGHGFTAGNRLDSQSVESNFNTVTTLLTQVHPDLPCFIVASDLGALTVCTYLGINKQIS